MTAVLLNIQDGTVDEVDELVFLLQRSEKARTAPVAVTKKHLAEAARIANVTGTNAAEEYLEAIRYPNGKGERAERVTRTSLTLQCFYRGFELLRQERAEELKALRAAHPTHSRKVG